MHEQDLAIVRALVPVAWSDGVFAEEEKETIEALLDAYEATEEEKVAIRKYAATKRTIDDIDLSDLSADDRRVLLNHAVLLCHIDGDYSEHEKKFLTALAERVKIPADEAQKLIESAADRAKKLVDTHLE